MKRITILLICFLAIGIVTPTFASSVSAQSLDPSNTTEQNISLIASASQTIGGWGLALVLVYLFWNRIKEQQQVNERLLEQEQARNDKVLAVLLKLLGDGGEVEESAPVVEPFSVKRPAPGQ